MAIVHPISENVPSVVFTSLSLLSYYSLEICFPKLYLPKPNIKYNQYLVFIVIFAILQPSNKLKCFIGIFTEGNYIKYIGTINLNQEFLTLDFFVKVYLIIFALKDGFCYQESYLNHPEVSLF